MKQRARRKSTCAVVGATLLSFAAATHAAEGDPAPPAPTPAPAVVPAAPSMPPADAAPPAGAPLLAGEPGWQMTFYGWAELDAMADTGQSFGEAVLNMPIARPLTYAGDNPRFQATAKDSRLGFKLSAPRVGSIKVSGQLETDFFGPLPATETQDSLYVFDALRMRLYFATVETPILTLLVGQTFDLFGWGGQGFLPHTAAFGVMGQVFHRNAQVRLSKVLPSAPVNLELAVAGVRPATRDSGTPDLQAGLKLTINGRRGALAQGPSLARPTPMTLALSGVGRRLTVNDFQAIPADSQVVLAGGVVADAFIPILPAHGQDLSNTLSVIGEFSTGTGISDLYLALTGGVLFPALPNAKNVLPAPAYTPNIDNGLVTFDVRGLARTINWQGLMINAQYNAPFRAGRLLSLSGTYSQITSSNALALTPVGAGQYFVWDHGRYIDGTLWWNITPSFQMAVSYQTMTQRYGDGTVARNNRGEAAWWFFF
jgi:hypothetical protein